MGVINYNAVADCLEEAREAFERLNPEQKQAVDAAIIKRLSRNAYEASLRIYETRNSRKVSNLVDIFDSVIRDYTDPDRISILRAYMIGFTREDFGQRIPLAAAAELEDNSNPFRPGTLREEKARELAAQGIDTNTFDITRSRLTAVPPIISFVGAQA